MPEYRFTKRSFSEAQNVYRSENCCTLGNVNVEEYAPSVLLVAVLLRAAALLAATVVSNRTEFVTLNTSQANFRAWRSVMFHDFVSPVSMSKKPSPR